MTLTHPWPAGDGAALSVLRLAFGSAMVVALVLGVRGLLRRDHSPWPSGRCGDRGSPGVSARASR